MDNERKPEIEPNSPQAQFEVQQIAEELRVYAAEGIVQDSYTLAKRLWRASKRTRVSQGRGE